VQKYCSESCRVLAFWDRKTGNGRMCKVSPEWVATALPEHPTNHLSDLLP